MNSIKLQIDHILVPQGAEYQAVSRVIEPNNSKKIKIIPVSAGIEPLKNYLKQWQQSQEFLENRPNAILLMGLGGSLSAKYRVGEGILCLQCSLVQAEQKPQWKDCDQKLNKLIKQHFGEKIRQGRLITSDRLIYLAREKQELGKWYQADVVDMEGIVLLDFCNSWQIPLVVIRVISDDYRQNLPNLTPAFEANGTLNPLLLTRQMLQNPLNSAHLIVCSLIALRKLQQIAKEISLM